MTANEEFEICVNGPNLAHAESVVKDAMDIHWKNKPWHFFRSYGLENHTWLRNDGKNWPSDRFLSCKKFNYMTVAARAKVIENIKGCPRCTAWSHARDKCKMPANNCGKEGSAGTKCKGGRC